MFFFNSVRQAGGTAWIAHGGMNGVACATQDKRGLEANALAGSGDQNRCHMRANSSMITATENEVGVSIDRQERGLFS